MRPRLRLSRDTVDMHELKALLIGESRQGCSYLANRLQERGCKCEFARSFEEADSLLRAQEYNFVLSATRLQDHSLFPLIDLLEGSGITLFYSHPVEDGCWWLPALQHGRRCFGVSALLPKQFVSVLDEAIHEAQQNLCLARRSA